MDQAFAYASVRSSHTFSIAAVAVGSLIAVISSLTSILSAWKVRLAG